MLVHRDSLLAGIEIGIELACVVVNHEVFIASCGKYATANYRTTIVYLVEISFT
jgi:hypothetical protein